MLSNIQLPSNHKIILTLFYEFSIFGMLTNNKKTARKSSLFGDYGL